MSTLTIENAQLGSHGCNEASSASQITTPPHPPSPTLTAQAPEPLGSPPSPPPSSPSPPPPALDFDDTGAYSDSSHGSAPVSPIDEGMVICNLDLFKSHILRSCR